MTTTNRVLEKAKNDFFASDTYGDFVRRVAKQLANQHPVTYDYEIVQTENNGTRLLKDGKYFMGYLPSSFKHYADIVNRHNIAVFIQFNAFSYSKLEVWIASIKGIIPDDLKQHLNAHDIMRTLIADFSLQQ